MGAKSLLLTIFPAMAKEKVYEFHLKKTLTGEILYHVSMKNI